MEGSELWNSANSDQDILEVQNVVLESIPPILGSVQVTEY